MHVSGINAYLADGPNVLVEKRMHPLAPDLTEATFGAMARDGGHLLVEPADYATVMSDPVAAKYVHRFVGARELIHGSDRWCLWLDGLSNAEVQRSPVLQQRLNAVREFRARSKAASTRAMAATPHLFGQRARSATSYVCIPRHVSETRRWFTVARMDADVVCGDANFFAPDADGCLFAIMSSSMFATWLRTVGGRLKSDLRFSNTLVWNTLPLPKLDDRQRAKIIGAGQEVLGARALYPDRSLADHNNTLAMDPALVRAHNALDVVVDRAFGAAKTCTSERERQAILFARYAEMTGSGTLR